MNEYISKALIRQKATQQINNLLAENHNNLSKVSRKLGVNKGLVSRVRDGHYSETVVVALGLDVVRPTEMPICLECGEVHEIKTTCASKLASQRASKRRRKAADLSPSAWGLVQNKALDEIAEAHSDQKTWSGYVVQLAEDRIAEWPADKLERVVEEAVTNGKS